jgi:hypothetical protein
MSVPHRPSYKDFYIRLEYYPAGSPAWLEAKAGLEAYARKMDRAYEKRYGRRPDVDDWEDEDDEDDD